MKQEPDLFLVIIAGGNGTRFWPKSTSKKPKQLLSFGSNSPTLLTQTLARFDGWVPPQQRMIVTTQFLRDAVVSEIPQVKILAEPQGRNTAPCIYWAARQVAEQNPDGIMVIMPADHHIASTSKFIQVIKTAAQWALENDDLVTLGIEPTRPETGFGYLKTTPYPASTALHFADIKQVASFVEKPSLKKAEEFLHSGNYYWNGGMFLWRAQVILNSFDQFMPEMKAAWEKAEGVIEKAYPKMTATSIDYGVMEKAKNVVTFPLNCGWDDLGSWTSLEGLADSLDAQYAHNTVTSGQLIALDSKNNIVDAPNRLVALLGIDNLIVVEQGDSILVAHKDRAQDIRRLVEEVKKTRPDLV